VRGWKGRISGIHSRAMVYYVQFEKYITGCHSSSLDEVSVLSDRFRKISTSPDDYGPHVCGSMNSG
jgi:hypothetical protein